MTTGDVEPVNSSSAILGGASMTSKPDPAHVAKAWAFFESIGSPKFHVAPMVDQSELPFRMLCRKYGSTCAYTPMLHARLFCGDQKYRNECWTTCQGDRPLFVQFCANDPEWLVQAAKMVGDECDAIDINFGCPQRIAKRGYYGAFLMDNLPLVEQLVTELVQSINKPVTVKIRVFPDLEKTLEYAKMMERCGASVVAVHGRTRDQKDNSSTRANWDYIKAVKQALSIPVLANGNVRDVRDALALLEYTGADGVLSAESLLDDPALFSPRRLQPGGQRTHVEGIQFVREYLENCLQWPVPLRMVKGHIHRIIGPWLAEHTDLRARINKGDLDIRGNLGVLDELEKRVIENGRSEPIPAVNPKTAARAEARQAAIEEQEREASALAALDAMDVIDAVVQGLDPATAAATTAAAAAAVIHPAPTSSEYQPQPANATDEQPAASCSRSGLQGHAGSGAGQQERCTSGTAVEASTPAVDSANCHEQHGSPHQGQVAAGGVGQGKVECSGPEVSVGVGCGDEQGEGEECRACW